MNGAGKGSRQYQVVGILSADNMLYLPGGKFASATPAKLRKWLDNLGDQGRRRRDRARARHSGCCRGSCEEVTADLKAPVTFSTKDISAADAVGQIGRQLKFSLAGRRGGHAGAGQGHVGRTSCAGCQPARRWPSMLRPAGLAIVPERPAGGELQYRVAPRPSGHESWPIGWQPQQAPDEAAARTCSSSSTSRSRGIPVSERGGDRGG